MHYGIKGQKHGVRRYQNEDGSLTPAGRARYSDDRVLRDAQMETDRNTGDLKDLKGYSGSAREQILNARDLRKYRSYSRSERVGTEYDVGKNGSRSQSDSGTGKAIKQTEKVIHKAKKRPFKSISRDDVRFGSRFVQRVLMS